MFTRDIGVLILSLKNSIYHVMYVLTSQKTQTPRTSLPTQTWLFVPTVVTPTHVPLTTLSDASVPTPAANPLTTCPSSSSPCQSPLSKSFSPTPSIQSPIPLATGTSPPGLKLCVDFSYYPAESVRSLVSKSSATHHPMVTRSKKKASDPPCAATSQLQKVWCFFLDMVLELWVYTI